MYLLKNNGARILVIGDLILDDYLWGQTNRISPEAPVAVVDVQNETLRLGGAGNVINNILSLEARAGVISALGDDENGALIKEMLAKKGIDTGAVITSASRHTSRKTRIMAGNQQMLRVDKESKEYLARDDELAVIAAIKESVQHYDCVLISDYAKGVVTPSVAQAAISTARAQNKPVLIDPKGKDYSKYKGATLLTPNKKEASQATGIAITDDASLERALVKLRADLDLDYSLITLSEDGIALYKDKLIKAPAKAMEVFDVTGAGDTVLATLGVLAALGQDLKEAIKIANTAAAVVVAKVGSATVTPEEISLFATQSTRSGIIKKEELDLIVAKLRRDGKKIVFTNGCFDILHRGHVKYLKESRSLGDVLIVGLNSDDSVRRLKGAARPINCQEDRAYVLAGLKSVDFVVIFDEDTPRDLIKLIVPDVLTKGADYKGKEVAGREFARELRLIDFEVGYSTTKIVERLQA